MSDVSPTETLAVDSTRERILFAAAAVLSRRGIAHTRLSEIAERAGVRPPAVYYHFPSREELIAEVLRVGQQQVRERVERAVRSLPEDASHVQRIAAACEAHVRIQVAMADFAGAVSRNAPHASGPLHEELDRESERYHDVWRALLSEAVAAGEIRADLDPSTARMLVIGALNWATEWLAPSADVDRLAAQAVGLVTHGLRTR